MKKMKNNSFVEIGLTTVFLGLLVYSAYSLWYIFNGTNVSFDIHLYTVLSGSALGWFMLMFVQTVFKNSKWYAKLIAFLAGNGLFQGVIWGINAKINAEGYDNDDVVIKAFTFAFGLSAILLLITFILRAKNKYRILNGLLAVVYFGVSCAGGITLNMENIRAIDYKKNIKFDTVTAEEMNITAEEKNRCSQWVSDNFYGENGGYPFTFKVDGEEFNPDEWEKLLTESPEIGSVYQGGKTEYIVLTNEDKGLEVTVEVTVFEENASGQWTVYIKNTGNENSGVITDFYALDSSFTTGNAEVYYSMGSNTGASDFSLLKKNLSSKERE